MLKHNGIQNKEEYKGQMSICSNMALSVLFLAIIIEKVLAISATLLMLSFPSLPSASESKIDVYITFYAFMSIILWISVSKMTFHFSVTSEADAPWMILQQNLQNFLMH